MHPSLRHSHLLLKIPRYDPQTCPTLSRSMQNASPPSISTYQLLLFYLVDQYGCAASQHCQVIETCQQIQGIMFLQTCRQTHTKMCKPVYVVCLASPWQNVQMFSATGHILNNGTDLCEPSSHGRNHVLWVVCGAYDNNLRGARVYTVDCFWCDSWSHLLFCFEFHISHPPSNGIVWWTLTLLKCQ